MLASARPLVEAWARWQVLRQRRRHRGHHTVATTIASSIVIIVIIEDYRGLRQRFRSSTELANLRRNSHPARTLAGERRPLIRCASHADGRLITSQGVAVFRLAMGRRNHEFLSWRCLASSRLRSAAGVTAARASRS